MKILTNGNIEFKENEYLWRYLSHQKLLSFLREKKLRFTRLDKFIDPLEGLTEEILGRTSIFEKMHENIDDLNNAIPIEERIKIIGRRSKEHKHIKESSQKMQTSQHANCWFIGTKESFAMWNQYSTSDGVVLQYNPKELLRIVIASAENYTSDIFQKFIYGRMSYKNLWPFDFFKKDENPVQYTAFKKDLSYEHEKEFRFVVVTPSNRENLPEFFELPIGDITSDQLKIIANPYMEEWKYENLYSILKLYQLDNKLVKSYLKTK